MNYPLNLLEPPPAEMPDEVELHIYQEPSVRALPSYLGRLATATDTWDVPYIWNLSNLLAWLHRHGFRPVEDSTGTISYTRVPVNPLADDGP